MWGHPRSCLAIGDNKSTPVYDDTNPKLVPWTKMEANNAMTNQPEQSKQKILR